MNPDSEIANLLLDYLVCNQQIELCESKFAGVGFVDDNLVKMNRLSQEVKATS